LSSKFVLVQVKDTSRGITPEEMEKLFDPYYQKLTMGQEQDNSGIGLALSKIIIELHQGKIWVEKRSWEGINFSFTIPIFVKGNGDISGETG